MRMRREYYSWAVAAAFVIVGVIYWLRHLPFWWVFLLLGAAHAMIAVTRARRPNH